MPSYKTEGIVLRRWNLGEADRVLSLFTKDYGRLSAIAKGIRKPLSRLRGHLEPFTRAHFVLHEGRNFDVITQAEAMSYYPALRANLQQTGRAYYIAELVESLSGERDRQVSMYQILADAFDEMDRGGDGGLLPFVELNLLANAGFRPELEKCVVDGEPLKVGKNFFSAHLGGAVCSLHRGSAGDSLSLSSNAIKVLRLFLTRDIRIVSKLPKDRLLEEELRAVLDRFLRTTLEKEPKTKKFLRELEKTAKSGQNEK